MMIFSGAPAAIRSESIGGIGVGDGSAVRCHRLGRGYAAHDVNHGCVKTVLFKMTLRVGVADQIALTSDARVDEVERR